MHYAPARTSIHQLQSPSPLQIAQPNLQPVTDTLLTAMFPAYHSVAPEIATCHAEKNRTQPIARLLSNKELIELPPKIASRIANHLKFIYTCVIK